MRCTEGIRLIARCWWNSFIRLALCRSLYHKLSFFFRRLKWKILCSQFNLVSTPRLFYWLCSALTERSAEKLIHRFISRMVRPWVARRLDLLIHSHGRFKIYKVRVVTSICSTNTDQRFAKVVEVVGLCVSRLLRKSSLRNSCTCCLIALCN